MVVLRLLYVWAIVHLPESVGNVAAAVTELSDGSTTGDGETSLILDANQMVIQEDRQSHDDYCWWSKIRDLLY